MILEAVGMYGRELYQLLPAFILGVALAATIKTFKWDLRLAPCAPAASCLSLSPWPYRGFPCLHFWPF
jgi:hypothetical protein